MGLYRRNKIYWFSIQYEGRRIHKSLKTDSKRLAEKLYAKSLVDIIEGRYFETVKAKNITFAEMVEKYMQKYQKLRDVSSIKPLLPVFGNLSLSEITTEIVSNYKESRLCKVKPATVYQELALMRRMFNVARKEWKWIKDNPVADLSFSVGNSNARDRWLTFEEEQILLSVASPEWVEGIIIFALHTGMRRGEILNLMWRDIEIERKLIIVQKSKNGTKRAIPISHTLYKILKCKKVFDISGKVFPVNIYALRDGFERAIKKAVIKDFRFHDLRHTFATRLVQNGVDLYKVKELLGHKTISMTARYAHHCSDSLRESISVLDKCYNSVTSQVQN